MRQPYVNSFAVVFGNAGPQLCVIALLVTETLEQHKSIWRAVKPLYSHRVASLDTPAGSQTSRAQAALASHPRVLPPHLPCFQSTKPPSTCLLGQKLRTQLCPASVTWTQFHLSSVSLQVQPPLFTFFHLHSIPKPVCLLLPLPLPPHGLVSAGWSVVLSKPISHHIAFLLTTLPWPPLTLVGSVLQAG